MGRTVQENLIKMNTGDELLSELQNTCRVQAMCSDTAKKHLVQCCKTHITKRKLEIRSVTQASRAEPN